MALSNLVSIVLEKKLEVNSTWIVCQLVFSLLVNWIRLSLAPDQIFHNFRVPKFVNRRFWMLWISSIVRETALERADCQNRRSSKPSWEQHSGVSLWAKFPVSLSNHFDFTPWLPFYRSSQYSSECFIGLKTVEVTLLDFSDCMRTGISIYVNISRWLPPTPDVDIKSYMKFDTLHSYPGLSLGQHQSLFIAMDFIDDMAVTSLL